MHVLFLNLRLNTSVPNATQPASLIQLLLIQVKCFWTLQFHLVSAGNEQIALIACQLGKLRR